MAPPLPHVAGVAHEEVVVRGRRVHVATAGPADGPVVVLEHGWPQHWYAWRALFGPLADAGLRVVAPDLRGFGWSEYPPDEDFRKETLADDVIALCDTLGVSRIRYAGHDWGGWSGYLLAARRPDLLERMVVLSVPHPFVDQPPPGAVIKRMVGLWYQGYLASPLPATVKRPFFRELLKRGRADDWTEEELEAFLGPLAQPSQVRASTLLYRDMLTREIPQIAGGRYRDARLDVPTRLLIGDKDAIYTDDATTIPDGRGPDFAAEVVPGAAHFLLDEHPDLVRDRLLGFLAP